MTEAKPAIFGTLHAALRGLWAAARAMPWLAACAFVIVLFNAAADAIFETAANDGKAVLHWHFFKAGTVVLFSFFITPIGIALFRYVLLREITERYVLNLSSLRVRKFFVYGVLINIPAGILFLLPGATEIIAVILWIVFFILATFALPASMLILFPAIAVDAPGVSIWNAVRDTHFWRAMLIWVVAMLPIIAMHVLVFVVLWSEKTPSVFTLEWVLYVAFLAAADFASVSLNVVAAPLYRLWAVRLKGL